MNDYGETLTVKYGSSHDSPWIVFKQPDELALREKVCAYFGIELNDVATLTMHELTLNVKAIATGSITASAMLGAVAIPAGQTNQVAAPTGNVWAGLDEEEPANPFQHVIDAFNAATDVKELQTVWAANQGAFSDDAVVAAYKARGKALQ